MIIVSSPGCPASVVVCRAPPCPGKTSLLTDEAVTRWIRVSANKRWSPPSTLKVRTIKKCRLCPEKNPLSAIKDGKRVFDCAAQLHLPVCPPACSRRQSRLNGDNVLKLHSGSSVRVTSSLLNRPWLLHEDVKACSRNVRQEKQERGGPIYSQLLHHLPRKQTRKPQQSHR